MFQSLHFLIYYFIILQYFPTRQRSVVTAVTFNPHWLCPPVEMCYHTWIGLFVSEGTRDKVGEKKARRMKKYSDVTTAAERVASHLFVCLCMFMTLCLHGCTEQPVPQCNSTSVPFHCVYIFFSICRVVLHTCHDSRDYSNCVWGWTGRKKNKKGKRRERDVENKTQIKY